MTTLLALTRRRRWQTGSGTAHLKAIPRRPPWTSLLTSHTSSHQHLPKVYCVLPRLGFLSRAPSTGCHYTLSMIPLARVGASGLSPLVCVT
ncbi:hypothetical protein FB451DRAFT_1559945 [Mycena latifolia]|nr:hypothetical protein FB451DRAFT_1559945 [Mycena latifolia]